jgi:hypothetical protein
MQKRTALARWLPIEGLNMDRQNENTEGRSTGNVEEPTRGSFNTKRVVVKM